MPRFHRVHRLTAFALLGLLLTLSGCSTFERRAQEKATTFAQLDDTTKERLKQGEVALGDTQDIVYIALGRADTQRETTKPEGTVSTWIYNSYSRNYEGTVTTGYRREVAYNPTTKRYVVFYVPERADVYSQNVDERFRVEFTNGKVTAFEAVK